MLILTRHRNESIIIGDDISIEVVGIDRGAVRLGITAPPWISVHRHEVYEAIQRERRTGRPIDAEDVRKELEIERRARFDRFEENGAA